mgnify:CR=1 FL=1
MKYLATLFFVIVYSACANAGLIEPSQATLSVNAVAGIDNSVALNLTTLDIPPSDAASGLPISASASREGQSFADALIDVNSESFFLDATTEAFSERGEFSDATAISEFQGVFRRSGAYDFFLNFETLNELIVPGIDSVAEASLFVEIMLDDIRVYSEFLISASQLAYRFRLEDMSSAVINIILSSNAVAGTREASSFNLASASFSVLSVPEPSSVLLIGSVLFGSRLIRRKNLH